MPVAADPALVAVDLRTYGEDAVAETVARMTREQLEPVFERAGHYLYNEKFATASGRSPLIAWTLAMAAVEVLEGEARPLRWKRRRLKGIYPGYD